MSATGFAYDGLALKHDPGRGHPERPARLEVTLSHLQTQPWHNELTSIAPLWPDHAWIARVHERGYIERARAACAGGESYLDVADVGISADSFAVAELAVGAGLALADAVIAGDISNGFSLMRPPGHHAERALALGFCVFNNVAVVAKYLQAHHGLDKIAIIDWDVHHGNGTQHAFEADPSVAYFSLHQFPFYPGTGAATETGTGAGEGFTTNCPMAAGASDSDYEDAFSHRVLPALERFAPQCVLISAGFDAHADDPLAQIEITDSMYAWMTERVLEVADKHANGRVISLLEGGYSLEALPRSVSTHLQGLLRAGAGSSAA